MFRGMALVGALAMVVALVPVGAEPAQALSKGVAFSAVAEPTWQADGVAYAVTSSQGKVVIGGSFTGLRPPGATATTRRQPVLAVLDADSGAPDSCQFQVGMAGGTPVVRALTTSPDGSTVYVGGDFTSVNGVAATRVAALDVAACSVRPLKTASSGFVYGLAATSDTLYLAGSFTTVTGENRRNFAAVDARTGDVLPWKVDADLAGRALAVSPDGTRVAVGGDFTTLNGTGSHALAVVDATTGTVVRAYTDGFIPGDSVTKGIVSDGQSFYTANEGTGTGIFDGRIAIDWKNLDQRWRDTCLGATQAVLPYEGILYSLSHAHNCGSMHLFPNGYRRFFMAQSTSDASIRGWFPQANDGIGEGIGGRALALAKGTSGAVHLYAVGEFTKINDKPQQSITRFGTRDTAPVAAPVLTASAVGKAAVQLRVGTVVDADDDTLTYKIFRDGSKTPIWSGRSTSWWWSRPQVTVTDRSVVAGRRYTYRVEATDGTNVSPLSDGVEVRASKKGGDYAARVVADGARIYWRFDEPGGRTAWNHGRDSAAAPAGLLEGGVRLGAKGAFGSDSAATFDGKDDFAWSDDFHLAPTAYSVEAWFKTTTKAGGKIIGFTNSRPRTNTRVPTDPTKDDRQIYMDDSGRLGFGVNLPKPVVVRTSEAYNDGRWHHVAATQGTGSGMRLYVDGSLVRKHALEQAQAPYWGVWKVGGDSLQGWPNRPRSDYFAGTIDEAAVYEGSVLPAAAVAKHYQLAGGKLTFNGAPSSKYGRAVYGAEPILYWPLDGRSRKIADKAAYGRVPAQARRSVKTHVKGAVGRAVTTKGKSSSTLAATKRVDPTASWSTELLFRSTSKKGGALLSLQDKKSGTSHDVDDVLYLTGRGAVAVGRAAKGEVAVQSSPGLADGRWHHVVAVSQGSTLTLFVDGRSVGATTVPVGASHKGYWRVGGSLSTKWPASTGSAYSGSVDEVAVFDRALSSSEVAEHAKLS